VEEICAAEGCEGCGGYIEGNSITGGSGKEVGGTSPAVCHRISGYLLMSAAVKRDEERVKEWYIEETCNGGSENLNVGGKMDRKGRGDRGHSL
jgi:hypothetical protein